MDPYQKYRESLDEARTAQAEFLALAAADPDLQGTVEVDKLFLARAAHALSRVCEQVNFGTLRMLPDLRDDIESILRI